MDFDVSGFLRAVFSDWPGILAGLISLILLTAGFFEQAAWQRRMLWSTGLLCFALVSVRAWTIEHKKLGGDIASLEPSISPFYSDGAPAGFPVGRPVRLDVLWANKGSGPALHVSDATFRIYPIGTNGRGDLKAALEDFKASFAKLPPAKEYADLFPAGNPQKYMAGGGILTGDLSRTIFSERRQTILLVGALKYADGEGRHEAHLCRWLSGIDPGTIDWTDCPEYTETVDIR